MSASSEWPRWRRRQHRPPGNTCGRHLRVTPAGGTCGRHLRATPAGGTCGQHLRAAPAGGTCGQHLHAAPAGGSGRAARAGTAEARRRPTRSRPRAADRSAWGPAALSTGRGVDRLWTGGRERPPGSWGARPLPPAAGPQGGGGRPGGGPQSGQGRADRRPRPREGRP